MSVTLKLSDQDAQIVGNILEYVGTYNENVNAHSETIMVLKRIEREFGSVSMVTRVRELEGAFKAAVRANQR